ncbi:unnamed protein product [Penicillium egyptiacum]|uniref:Uncharacterized protein n=1 Tax=Penicillium egyptiacum TaxID=1303716 RepID=A0A9W4KGM4_9EURO|nr:unnamed protein product [Penicillium egyptiacum]
MYNPATMSLNIELDLGTETSGSFLSDLGSSIRSYPYKGVKQFLGTLEMELRRQEEDFDVSECVLFTGVNKQAVNRDFLNSDDQIIQRCWNFYDCPQNLILIKMRVSRAHEIATQQFERQSFKSLGPMGLDDVSSNFRICHFCGKTTAPQSNLTVNSSPRDFRGAAQNDGHRSSLSPVFQNPRQS